MSDQPAQSAMLSLTAKVVSAYVSNNPLPASDLREVIGQIHQSLSVLQSGQKELAPELVPAVPIKKSVTPDYIISLEDGRKLKSMKRYLGLRGMTPAEYKQKWGLPSTYPMVAPNYSAARSELAKGLGLGRKKPANAPGKTQRARSKARAA